MITSRHRLKIIPGKNPPPKKGAAKSPENWSYAETLSAYQPFDDIHYTFNELLAAQMAGESCAVLREISNRLKGKLDDLYSGSHAAALILAALIGYG